VQHVTFDAFFEDTMFHEVAHGLGIKNTLDGKGTVTQALKEYASNFEEGKADVLEVKNEAGQSIKIFIDQQTHMPLMLQYMEVRPRMMFNGPGGPGGPGGRGMRGGPGAGGPPPIVTRASAIVIGARWTFPLRPADTQGRLAVPRASRPCRTPPPECPAGRLALRSG